MKISTIAAALLLSPSEAYAAQVGRMRKVKLYSSSSSLRRDSDFGRDVADPYLGLPDEGHRQLQGSMSVSMSMSMSMSIPIASMPIQVAPTTTAAATTTTAATTTAAATTTVAPTTTVAATTTAAATTTESPPTTTGPESSMSIATTTSMSYATTTTTTTNPTDVVDTTTTATLFSIATTTEATVPAPTPFSANALETPDQGALSSAMMMGQSALVVATVVCAVAGVVALM